MATIRKRTTKVTKEAMAKKIYKSLTSEQQEQLYILLGKITCGEVKNFYSTKIFKVLTKDLTNNQKAVVTYICRKNSLVDVFENMEELVLSEE